MSEKAPTKPERVGRAHSAATRGALLDAAEQIMLEEGYAAVSSRRLAARAGVNPGLVYYHYDTMDNLFVELFRRGAERSYERQRRALESPQPLWALWEAIHDQSQTSLTMEFVSMANHRETIWAEIAQSSRRFRHLQLDAVTDILAAHPDIPPLWTPTRVVMLMSSISRQLRMEESFDIDTGHAETIELIEDFLRSTEGERRSPDPR
ncbi:TetR/AcrR family transcriptional regulator [Nocardia takedensis]|uniref:TetR/AcrR family transcriptional regulator n=1 Tax=Nocardia takedensis TaxID=259390 RepID=UPI0002D48706|nr:TetR/AcrR family transcriptional regulator [Nocardia takedensis]